MRELQHYYYVKRVINKRSKLLGKANEEKSTNDIQSHPAFLEGKETAE